MYKKKSTESFQSVPYVVALLSAMLWLYYALLSMDVLLLSINAIACVVESVYLAIYLVYAPKDAMVGARARAHTHTHTCTFYLIIGCFI